MAEAFIVRRGGGAGGGGTVAGEINFEIYYGSDTSELSNPKENTIFAVTETAVPKWQFSGIEPANPVNGMLWFVLGNTGKNMMNITTGNPTIIYCDSVKQYADGAWTSVDVYSRINGSWKQFSAAGFYIFQSGNISANKFTVTEGSPVITAESIYIAAPLNRTYRVSSEYIDASKYRMLYVDCICTSTDSTQLYIDIENKSSASIIVVPTGNKTRETIKVDISEVNADVRVTLRNDHADKEATIYNVWLD